MHCVNGFPQLYPAVTDTHDRFSEKRGAATAQDATESQHDTRRVVVSTMNSSSRVETGRPNWTVPLGFHIILLDAPYPLSESASFAITRTSRPIAVPNARETRCTFESGVKNKKGRDGTF